MSDSSGPDLTFEQALTELDRLVRTLEDGQLGLEEALVSYEMGVGLLKRCYTQLEKAEQRILLLTGEDAEGQPITRPFDHTASLEVAKKGTIRRRRKSDDPEIPFSNP